MACGTGETFTALRLAEQNVGPGGKMLFLVPSISLLSQTIREWVGEAELPIRALAVCSDAKSTRRAANGDNEDISVTDLALPATTKVDSPCELIAHTGLTTAQRRLSQLCCGSFRVPSDGVDEMHRLFSFISVNWRGRPLTNYQVIVETIAATITKSGLTVQAVLDTATYPTGLRFTKAQFKAVPLTRHDFHGEWNFTIHSGLTREPPRDMANGRKSTK